MCVEIFYLNVGSLGITTSKCVLVHSRFHKILNEFIHFYHGETNQPLRQWGPIIMDNELIH
jgi:hypothetical protein